MSTDEYDNRCRKKKEKKEKESVWRVHPLYRKKKADFYCGLTNFENSRRVHRFPSGIVSIVSRIQGGKAHTLAGSVQTTVHCSSHLTYSHRSRFGEK